MALRNTIQPISFGADPEFCVVTKDDKIVKAGNYVDKDDPIGKDNNGINFEAHPKPSECPVKIVENIQKLFQDFVVDDPFFFENCQWLSHSFYKKLPYGGHIHFDYDSKTISPEDCAGQFLDQYVGSISLLLEDRKEGIARRSYDKSPSGADVSYGRCTDIRKKTKNHWEYRTPSTWLQTPAIAIAMLSLTKVVVFEAVNNPSFRPNVYVEADDFIKVNQEKLRRLFPRIWSDIRKMTLYPQYKQQLRIIHYFITNNLTWLPKKKRGYDKSLGNY
jgi:hypothetical protein